MSKMKVEAEGDSLEEAKLKLKAKIPSGSYVLREWSTGGSPEIVQIVAKDAETAFTKAETLIPNNAVVIDRKILSQAEQAVLNIQANDELSACSTIARQIEEDMQIEGLDINVKSEQTDLMWPEFIGISFLCLRQIPHNFSLFPPTDILE